MQQWNAYAESVKLSGINGTVSLVTVPMGKNTIMLRIQNLADPYDSTAMASKVRVNDLVNHMRTYMNKQSVEFKLTETSVTGNMPVEEMQARRAVWHTVDDNMPGFERSKISYDSGDVITLEP